ncbi:protein of unknown function [bacterium A37T11]|nr:protein of unknown function [bacterium A37T11]
MDYYYKDYIIERTYVGKPDSIWVKPGNKRVQIGLLTPKDVDAKDLVVHWGSTDSVILTIDHTLDKQSIIIDNLVEQDYVFNAYTRDKLGNHSLPMELSTTVYGDNFKSTILPLVLNYSVVFPDSIALVWDTAPSLETLFGSEIQYTDNAGIQQTFISPLKPITIFHDADPNKPISVRTAYIPDSNAFEYFYTEPVVLDMVATKKSSLTFSSAGYKDAAYVDFKFVRTFLSQDVPAPIGKDIDMCYALGGGSRGNFFTMDGTGFSAFTPEWQSGIASWPVRNVTKLKLERNGTALSIYDGLDELNRSQMIAAYDNSTAVESTRLSSLAVNDIIFLHSADRGIYVAIKVISTPPDITGAPGNFVIDFKVSRP